MIPLLPLRLSFTANAPLKLPAYPGSLWRGAFGATLRRHACITGAPTCTGCPVKAQCAYGFLYETPQPRGATGLAAHYPDLPHPYILSPRHDGGTHAAHTPLDLDFTLVAPAHAFLSTALTTARNLRLGPVSLTLATLSLKPPAATRGMPETDPAAIATAQPALPIVPTCPPRVELRIQHPLRLRRDNQYLGVAQFDFATFFTTLVRRISMLAALSGAALPDDDYAALAAAARQVQTESIHLKWVDWARNSARQHRHIPMGGVTGTVILAGDLSRVWPWLWVGQWVHVGKGAVMGAGRYRLVLP